MQDWPREEIEVIVADYPQILAVAIEKQRDA